MTFLSPDDFWDEIHPMTELDDKLSYEDSKLALDVPMVISYELVDLDKTDYHFKQVFTLYDTQRYFEVFKEISCRSINDLLENSKHSLHFYRSAAKGNLKLLLEELCPGCVTNDSEPMIFHFALYTDSERADRKLGRRSPRVYFMLGRNGMIFPLFFDPYHEINP